MFRKPYLPLLAVALLLVIACGGSPGGGGTKKILMEVSGPPQADITYGIGADQSQATGSTLPWKKELSSSANPLIVVVSAQSKADSGQIVCRITIDGKIVKENQATGQFAVVTCSNS